MNALMAFFNEVETLNRGLDLAQPARDSKEEGMLQAEVRRNRVKAGRLWRSDASDNLLRPRRASSMNK